MNIHTNVFFFPIDIFLDIFSRCSRSLKIALGDENAIEHNIKLVHWIAHPLKFRLYTDTSIKTINEIVITIFFAQYYTCTFVHAFKKVNIQKKKRQIQVYAAYDHMNQ